MKRISSKRAKACAIPNAVKERVWERDHHCCVYCKSIYASPEAHYIPRSRGGLGIEENVLTLCRLCHDAFDCGRRSDTTAVIISKPTIDAGTKKI